MEMAPDPRRTQVPMGIIGHLNSPKKFSKTREIYSIPELEDSIEWGKSTQLQIFGKFFKNIMMLKLDDKACFIGWIKDQFNS